MPNLILEWMKRLADDIRRSPRDGKLRREWEDLQQLWRDWPREPDE